MQSVGADFAGQYIEWLEVTYGTKGENMAPKVFVSHASEDKKRFVLEFATKLRNNGIDAWLDK